MGAPVPASIRASASSSRPMRCFPWRSVIDNVAAGPLFRGRRKAEAHDAGPRLDRPRRPRQASSKHYPHQLSGGMRKRVALAQTFINEPEILLMDEPFSALDMQTRTLMQDELLQPVVDGTRRSVVFVTHDLEEAIALADRVFVLTAGPATVKRVYDIDLPRPRVTARDPLRAAVHRDLRASGTTCARKCRSAMPAAMTAA